MLGQKAVEWSTLSRQLEYSLGLVEIGSKAQISKYRLAHLDFHGELNSKPDLFFSLFLFEHLNDPLSRANQSIPEHVLRLWGLYGK